MGEAEGVASYSAVKAPVWLAKAASCQGPFAVVVTHCGETVSDAVAVWLRLPLLAAKLNVEVPVGVELLVLTVNVHDPVGGADSVQLLGAIARLLLAVIETVPLKPFKAATLAV
jgi:hypothetical protein